MIIRAIHEHMRERIWREMCERRAKLIHADYRMMMVRRTIVQNMFETSPITCVDSHQDSVCFALIISLTYEPYF
jgi:DNA-binding ferritin-like protein (Dps family)